MNIFRYERVVLLGVPVLFASLLLFAALLIAEPKNASAQAAPGVTCDVVIALDKSSSIGADNLQVLNQNIKDLTTYFSGRPDVRVAY